MIGRRGLLTCLTGLIAAPAIIKVADLMPVKSVDKWIADENIHSMLMLSDQRGNSILTINEITREAVQLFKNSNLFLQEIDRQYEHEYAWGGARIGDTMRIRLPINYVPDEGHMSSPDVLYGQLQLSAAQLFVTRAPAPPVPELPNPAVLVLGAAVVLTQNPVVSRRFWKMSRETTRHYVNSNSICAGAHEEDPRRAVQPSPANASGTQVETDA